MRAGKLRHRLQIHVPFRGRDAEGGSSNEWGLLFTRWGEVNPLGGRELLKAQAVDASITHSVKMRSVSGLKPEMRILHDARVFNIVRILDKDERGIEHEVMCAEKDGETATTSYYVLLNDDGNPVTNSGEFIFVAA